MKHHRQMEDCSPMEAESPPPPPPTSLAADLFAKASDRSESEWRRDEQRRDIREDVLLEIPGEKHPVPAFTYQVSPTALTICCRRELERDLAVSVRRAYVDDGLCDAGHVVHCTQTIGGYKVGIKFP